MSIFQASVIPHIATLPCKQKKDNCWAQNLNLAKSQSIWLYFLQKVLTCSSLSTESSVQLLSVQTPIHKTNGNLVYLKGEKMGKRDFKVLCTHTRKQSYNPSHLVFLSVKLVITWSYIKPPCLIINTLYGCVPTY